MSSPISGFTAIPNPQMLAFMPIQSYLMMYFAGSAWQFGKRKISAKSNEEFNALTMKTLLEEHTMELKSVIPTLERSLNDVTPLVEILIKQYGDFIREALKALPEALQNIIGGGGGDFSNIPTTASQTGTGLGPAQTASFLHYFKTLADATKNTNTPKITQEINLNKPSTISGLTIGEARQQAVNKQLAFEQLQRQKVQSTKVLTKISEPIPQVRQGIEKRAAGQSAIMERKKLIKDIVHWNTQMRSGSTQFKRQSAAVNLRNTQQRLVNLLARYRF